MIEYDKLPKNIIVTGGSGFIGGAVIRRLLKFSNSNIYNFDKLGYASNENFLIDEETISRVSEKYFFIKYDLSIKNNIAEIIQKIKPDLIFHLAAESHVDRSIKSPTVFLESNIIGTFNLLESVRFYFEKLSLEKQKKLRFIHISTDEVFGSLGEKGFFDENSAYSPNSPYSASKAASDHLVNAWHNTYNLPTISTNCSNNYGPYQFPEKLIPLTIINCLKDKKIPLYGNGLNVRDWLFVEDHVDALLKIALNGIIGKKYCIGGGEELSNKDIIENICDVLQKKLKLENNFKELISYVSDRPGHDFRYAINACQIKDELGWVPRIPFKKGIELTIDWYLNNHDWWEKILQKNMI